MKMFSLTEVIQMQNSVPGSEFATMAWAVVSSNYYDPGIAFHCFVDTEEEGKRIIQEYKNRGHSLKYSITKLACFVKYA
jgi:hypothetical protein